MLIITIIMSVITFVLGVVCILIYTKLLWAEKGSRCMSDSRDKIYRQLCLVQKDLEGAKTKLNVINAALGKGSM